MDNSVTLTADGIYALYAATYFLDIASTMGRFNTYGREAEPEPGDIMGWEVNDITLKGGPDIILEGVSYICNNNSKVVSKSYRIDQTECGI